MVQELDAVVHFLVQNLQSTPYFGATLSETSDMRLLKLGWQSTPPAPPPPENSKIADLDRVFKVGLAKYAPPPPKKIQK